MTQWKYIAFDCCSQTDKVPVMCSVIPHSIFTVQILYKLYSLELNCTYSNYTEAAATCSAAQQHSTFTVQILYKLYSLQLNGTYSNYIEAAVTSSASYRTAHLLYKYCTNCTVCNWTVLTVITQKLLLQVQRLTAQHIYCTNTVQTVQSATELYLQ